MANALLTFEFAILDFIQAHISCAFLDFVMPLISAIGNHGEVWILAALLLCCTQKYRKDSFMVLVGLLVGLFLGNLLFKNLIARPRPCWLRPEMLRLIPCPEDFSFPSGHTLSSFIAAFLLTKINPKFGYAAIPLAILMAFSRLYLYVHFPTDILGAILLAAGIAFAIWKIFQWKKKPKNREQKRGC